MCWSSPLCFVSELGFDAPWHGLVQNEYMYQSSVFSSCGKFLIYAIFNEMKCVIFMDQKVLKLLLSEKWSDQKLQI